MRPELQKATESYIRNRNKIDDLQKVIKEKGMSMPLAKLQKSAEISDAIGKQMLLDKQTIKQILPALSNDEYVEWYEMMKPYFSDRERRTE